MQTKSKIGNDIFVLSMSRDSMEDQFDNLFSSCLKTEFGEVTISDEQMEFCSKLNKEIIIFCKSLPISAQTDGLLFFMRYFKIPFESELKFFSNYYPPAWSIIYWLIRPGLQNKRLNQNDVQNAKTAHAMALFLHPLDDHLSDGELQVTYLNLLIRSQLWMVMNKAFKRLSNGVESGEQLVQGFIDDYYSSIRDSNKMLSLDNYCDRFRKQMAIWLIAPVLLTKKIASDEKFTDAIQKAYGSFGIAWRLLDDINDIKIDMEKGTHSCVYFCLSEDMKNLWNKQSGGKIDKTDEGWKIIWNYFSENNVIDDIKNRICKELESAAFIAQGYNMKGLADEFRCLLSPLQNKSAQL